MFMTCGCLYPYREASGSIWSSPGLIDGSNLYARVLIVRNQSRVGSKKVRKRVAATPRDPAGSRVGRTHAEVVAVLRYLLHDSCN